MSFAKINGIANAGINRFFNLSFANVAKVNGIAKGGASNGLLNNLISHWTFDETSGTRNDDVSTSHLTESGTVASGTGALGNCAVIAVAGSEYLTAANAMDAANNGTGLTFNLWIYPNGLASYSAVFEFYNAARALSVFINSVSDGYIAVTAGGGGAAAVSPTFSPNWTTGAWQMLTVTIDSSTVTVYRNGTSCYSGDISAALGLPKDSTLYLGNNISGGGSRWDGKYDEAGLWSTILTGSQITALYNSGTPLSRSSYTV